MEPVLDMSKYVNIYLYIYHHISIVSTLIYTIEYILVIYGKSIIYESIS